MQKCLSNDQTVIKDIQGKVNYQLNGTNKIGYIFLSNDKIRNHRGANSTTQPEATQAQFSDTPWGFANPTHQIQHTWIADRQAGVQQPGDLRRRRLLPRLPGSRHVRRQPLHPG